MTEQEHDPWPPAPPSPLRALLQVPPGGPAGLDSRDPAATPGAPPRGKNAARAEASRTGAHLAGLQERLYAAATTGDTRRLLLVLQGMDTSGKGGTVKHVIGALNPAGCRITAFRTPTPQERAHGFLWRIERALPRPGEIGIFDRSHYEDVLVPRVHGLLTDEETERRHEEINWFESALATDGLVFVKVFLHISHAEQRRRLLRRLDDPTKQWKFHPSDIEERDRWAAYHEAYTAALERCSTPAAPWYVVPADHKWYRNWAVGRLLAEHLEDMDPQYPPPRFDVAAYRARLAAE